MPNVNDLILSGELPYVGLPSRYQPSRLPDLDSCITALKEIRQDYEALTADMCRDLATYNPSNPEPFKQRLSTLARSHLVILEHTSRLMDSLQNSLINAHVTPTVPVPHSSDFSSVTMFIDDRLVQNQTTSVVVPRDATPDDISEPTWEELDAAMFPHERGGYHSGCRCSSCDPKAWESDADAWDSN